MNTAAARFTVLHGIGFGGAVVLLGVENWLAPTIAVLITAFIAFRSGWRAAKEPDHASTATSQVHMGGEPG